MAKKLLSQTSFTSGELSPRLYSRTETDEYGKGLETATNCLVTPHGPIKRRNGTQYISHTKDSTDSTRLVRFQFSQDDSFVIEFGDSIARFYTNSGQVTESAQNITGITQANPAVVTISSHGYSNGDQVYITSVTGMTEINDSNIPYIIANVTANTFEVQDIDGNNVDSSGFTAYSSGGTSAKIYTITTPYDDTEVQDIVYTQFGNKIYIAHPDFEPRVLTRNSSTDWTLTTLSASPPPTYEAGDQPATTVTPAATSGTGVNFTLGAGYWLDADVGRQIVNNSTGETGRAVITSVTSTTVAVCDIVEDFTDTNAIASGDWTLDLSPICDLEVDGTSAGSIINVRSEYNNGSVGPRLTITNVTAANPAVVTSASHGLIDGDKVRIQDIVGMTELNNTEFTVTSSTTNTFALKGEDSTSYNTYSSGGIARKVLTNIAIDAFRTGDVGRYILINGGVLQIVTRNAADDIDCEVLKSLNSSDSTGNWTLEDDTWDATRGFPRAVGQFEQRLVFGGTTAQPQTLWFSEIGIYDGFGTGPDDDDSIEVDIASDEVNEINWLSASRDLVIGTSGGEITISSGTSSSITPSSIKQTPRTAHGSARQQPTKIIDEVLFLQNSTRSLISFRYDFNIDSYRGDQLTFLSEHLTEGGLKRIAYSQEPDSIIYMVTNNGDLLAAVFDRNKKVIGITKYETDGTFEDVITIGSGEIDQVWVVVKRTVNGNTRRFIELFDSGDGVDDTDRFSDCSLTLSTPLTITGITAADPAVVTTSAAHGLSNGDVVIIKDLVDPLPADLDTSLTNMSSLNNCTFTVANKTSTTFELTNSGGSNIDTSNYNAYGSGGNAFLKVTTISGLDHLEGKVVQVKTDGASHPDKTVSSGSITLDSASGEVVIGLPYTTTIKTLRHDYDIGMGSMQGQRARWARPIIRVYRSAKPTLNGELSPARSGDDAMDKKLGLFSTDLEYGPLTWSNETQLTFALTNPFPLVISGIFGLIDSNVK